MWYPAWANRARTMSAAGTVPEASVGGRRPGMMQGRFAHESCGCGCFARAGRGRHCPRRGVRGRRDRLAIATADGASRPQIVVQGNRRVEARRSGPTSAWRRASGSTPPRSTPPTRRCSPPACSRTCRSGGRVAGSSSPWSKNRCINRVAFEGNKRVKDEQLLQEIQSKPRGTFSRADGAGRRPAHRRDLSSQRALRRPGRAEDHRAAEQSRRSGLRDQRGRKTTVKASSSSATTPISDWRLRT